MKKNILAIIPARGNSKGIIKKNIVKILGKPLIYYTIKEAKKSKFITDLVLSTDSKEIKKIAEKFGATVPFLRPRNLSTDFIPSLPVIKHATNFMEKAKGLKYDYILMLQPTSPLRKCKDIDNSIKKIINRKCHSITSIVNVGGNHPFRMKVIKQGKLKNFVKKRTEDMRPRQKLKKIYIRNGSIYLSTRDTIMKQNKLVGKENLPYLMPKERSVNIDTWVDLLSAEYYLRKKK
tara:strand:+ start:20971 stop:21672 length:702 start_codon:yes stop_codon:yes gene_type:complete